MIFLPVVERELRVASRGFRSLFGLAADLYFSLTTRIKLRAEFRTIVAEGVARKRLAEFVPKRTPVLMEAR
jgi:hypothetical protein